jgi:hypothetical protein
VSLSLQYNDKPIDQDHDLEATQEQANHYHPTPSSRLPGSRLIRSRLVNNKLTKMSSSSPDPEPQPCIRNIVKCEECDDIVSDGGGVAHATSCRCEDDPPVSPTEVVSYVEVCDDCKNDEEKKV